MLQIVGEVASSGIARIHRNEDTHISVELAGITHQFYTGQLSEHSLLDSQDLLRASRKDSLFQSVELIEAAPRADLAETSENTTHGSIIETLVAVEYKHESPQLSAKHLNTFRLSSTSRSEWISTETKVKGLGEREVAAIGQRSMHETFTDAQVFKAVEERGVRHLNCQSLHKIRLLRIPIEPEVINPSEVRLGRNVRRYQ